MRWLLLKLQKGRRGTAFVNVTRHDLTRKLYISLPPFSSDSQTCSSLLTHFVNIMFPYDGPTLVKRVPKKVCWLFSFLRGLEFKNWPGISIRRLNSIKTSDNSCRPIKLPPPPFSTWRTTSYYVATYCLQQQQKFIGRFFRSVGIRNLLLAKQKKSSTAFNRFGDRLLWAGDDVTDAICAALILIVYISLYLRYASF